MNEAKGCDVVQDLLPGYIDDVLSDTGRELVKKHLEECGECHEIYMEMKDGDGRDDLSFHDAAAVDWLKKIRKRTIRLKMTIGILAGILFLLLLSAALKIYVIGKPLETGHISVLDTIYDEETGQLAVNGEINLHFFRVSKVAWKEDEYDPSVVNVIVYHAETLPFLQDQTDFSVTIPDVKGKRVYLACPEYDRMEIYDWQKVHAEEVDSLKAEIYAKIPELDEETDALSCQPGIATVGGAEGICFSVDFIYGENASYWWYDDALITDGEVEPADYEIWISLTEPHIIRIHDDQTGEYTDDFSIISDRKGDDASGKQQSGETMQTLPDAPYAYEGTVFEYEGQKYDIADREPLVTAITDCKPAGKYIVVEGHCGPKNSLYGIFDTETESFEKNIAGSNLIWHDEDITTAVYSFWSGIYAYDGSLLADLALSEGDLIYGLEFRDGYTKVAVTIQTDDGSSYEEIIEL